MSRILKLIALVAFVTGISAVTQAKGPPDSVDTEVGREKTAPMKKNAEKKMKKARKQADSEMAEEKEKVKGLEKQREKKTEQVRKELDKGSEKGKAMRKEHSRKWWKFWGNDEEESEPAEE